MPANLGQLLTTSIFFAQSAAPAKSDSGLNLKDIIEITAIFTGPIAALWIQRILDGMREKRSRQLELYATLMRLRGASLTPEFVNALNMIDVIFNGGKSSETLIRSKWKTLMDHFNTKQTDGDAWGDKKLDLTVDLLNQIGLHLGFRFDPSHIKRQVYFPQVLSDQWNESHRLRKSLLEVLDGKGTRKIPVAVFEKKFPDTK